MLLELIILGCLAAFWISRAKGKFRLARTYAFTYYLVLFGLYSWEYGGKSDLYDVWMREAVLALLVYGPPLIYVFHGRGAREKLLRFGTAVLVISIFVLYVTAYQNYRSAASFDWNRVMTRAEGIKLESFVKQTRGASQEDIIAELGKPARVVTREDIQKGMTYVNRNYLPLPNREVKHSVLVYYKGYMVAYIFLGEDKKVEAFRVAERP